MSAEPTAKRGSPLEPSDALSALEHASDREQIFELLLRAARSRTRFAALLSVHADEIRGRKGLADDELDASQVDTVRIPRGSVPAFETAITSQSPSVGAVATGEPFVDGFLDSLGGAPRAALIVPVVLGARTVALVVGHRGNADLTMTDVSDLFPVVNASNPALARVVSSRAKTVADARPQRRLSSADYEVEITGATVAMKRAALAGFRDNQAWEELAEGILELVYDGIETGDPDEDEQLTLLIELGKVEAEQLGRPDRALEAWQSAQTIDAADPRVLDAMEGLFVQQGRWQECVDLLEKRVALSESEPERIAMLLNVAAMARERLGDDELAIASYDRILKWQPAHEVASRELEQLYWSAKNWPPLAALLLDRASRNDDDDDDACVTALESVAQMYEDKLDDPRAAVLVWIAIARRAPARAHLVDQLDRLAPAANAWDELIAECEALAGELESSHATTAAALWQLVGRWTRDHLANRERAAGSLDRALRLAPTNADARDELQDLLRAENRWSDLAALLSQRVEAEREPERRSELNRELGEIYERQLSLLDEAAACYRRALDDEPESPAALLALHRVYLATEAWSGLVELLPRLIDALAPSEPATVIVDLHVELGTVLADRLDRPESAARAFHEALALDPTHTSAFAGIKRIYETTGQTEALLDATEAVVDASTRSEQLQRYGDLAAAWHDHARLDRATECWQKLLALDPKHLAGHQGLARTLRDDHQWGELASALRAQLALLTTPAERGTVLLELAGVLENQLDDIEGATAACQDVLKLDPDHHAALVTLARLYERAGRLQPALDLLQRLLEQTTDPRPRADLLQRIGHVHLSARDAASARLHLVQALALDINNARAREALARVHLQQGELVAAGEELIRAAQLSTNRDDTVRCLFDAAWTYRHRLGDMQRARDCLDRILALEPDHADAKQAMAQLLHDSREWETLWPHLEQQVRKINDNSNAPIAERHDAYMKAGRCALELGKFSAALELYDQACAIDPKPATQLERAEALHRSGALEPAAAAYQEIATQHGGSLERAQLTAVFRRLAQIHTELGKPTQAQMFHQKVLDIDATDRDALRDLAELHLARNRFDEAIANLRALAGASAGADRVTLLERIGDLYRHQLANPARASSTYLEALELAPANHRVLQRLLDLQTEAGQWKPAVETIGRFLEAETDHARRGAYFLASAEIRRTELKDQPGALECYDRALDELMQESPLRPATRARSLEVFHLIDTLLTGDKNWAALEQAYLRMIKRMPAGDPVLVHLWHALGEIYRSRIKHYQTAIEAFEVAHALDPDKSPQRTAILAELYSLIGTSQLEQVSDRAAKLVEVDPTNPDSYRALGKTALEAGRIDEAWCVARALVFLNQATAQEQALYRQYQPHELRKAKGILDDDHWSLLQHADEDRAIGSIFSVIWEGLVALRAGTPKSFQLKAKERMPIEDGTRVVAKIFRHASRMLNVSLPDIYIQPRRAGRLFLANCVEKGRLVPAVIVGSDLMRGFRDVEIAAAVGAMIALLRPAYYLKLTLPTVEELEAALAAAARLVGKKIGRPELEPLINVFVPELQKRVTRTTGEALASFVNGLPDRPDLLRWRNAVDAAAQRAGLLVCGELSASARMVSTEAAPLGGPRPTQRVQELVAYSVSSSYFAARKHLGVAIE
ncbi:MAG: tetratricopeptide repeat protein [Kofleriaceae bacterium]